MTQKPTPEGLDHFVEEVRKAHTPDDVLERQNLLARINELEQILNNERTVGRQKIKDELAGDVNDFIGNTLSRKSKGQLKFYIEQWKPRGE